MVLDIMQMQAIMPCSFKGQRAGLNSFTSLNDHFAESPADGSLIDFIHRLKMMFLFGFQQSFFSSSSLGFGVGIPQIATSQSIVAANID